MGGLPCSDLRLLGQGTWEFMALGFMMQFLIVCSAFFEWLWLNSYGNAFSYAGCHCFDLNDFISRI